MRYALALLLLIAPLARAEELISAAEEKYSSEVTKAESDLAKVKQAASTARLKAYRDKLVEATKAGDFDKATALKARIETLEADPDSKSQKKPRPKDTVRFDGHTYALIKEPATWHVAKHRCEEMGGHLVCINNPKESEFVAKLCGNSLTSIGASDEVEEGAWLNVDGSVTSLSAPLLDNHQGLDHWLMWDGSTFVDWHAGGRVAFICEWSK